jgi:hypothetical protein
MRSVAATGEVLECLLELGILRLALYGEGAMTVTTGNGSATLKTFGVTTFAIAGADPLAAILQDASLTRKTVQLEYALLQPVIAGARPLWLSVTVDGIERAKIYPKDRTPDVGPRS